MDLFIDRAGHPGLCAQLYEQIREGIASGRLRAGDQLPPSRALARQLGISRYTVTTAYERLAAEGFISGRAGGGSIVAEVPVLPPPAVRRRAAIRPRPGIGERPAEPRPWAAAAAGSDVRGVFFVVEPHAGQLRELARLIDDQQLRPMVSRVFELNDLAEAFRALRGERPPGKVVISVSA